MKTTKKSEPIKAVAGRVQSGKVFRRGWLAQLDSAMDPVDVVVLRVDEPGALVAQVEAVIDQRVLDSVIRGESGKNFSRDIARTVLKSLGIPTKRKSTVLKSLGLPTKKDKR